MSLSERVIWFLIGVAIGFVLGYIVRALRNIERKLDDKGFTTNRFVMNVAMALVLALTVWATVSTQLTNNRVQDTQDKLIDTQNSLQDTQDNLQDAQRSIRLVSSCTAIFLSETIVALNERTTYTRDLADANVHLQRSQLKFFSFFLVKPPPTRAQSKAAFEDYLNALTKFVSVSGKSTNKVATNPYPTNQELQDCLEGS